MKKIIIVLIIAALLFAVFSAIPFENEGDSFMDKIKDTVSDVIGGNDSDSTDDTDVPSDTTDGDSSGDFSNTTDKQMIVLSKGALDIVEVVTATGSSGFGPAGSTAQLWWSVYMPKSSSVSFKNTSDTETLYIGTGECTGVLGAIAPGSTSISYSFTGTVYYIWTGSEYTPGANELPDNNGDGGTTVPTTATVVMSEECNMWAEIRYSVGSNITPTSSYLSAGEISPGTLYLLCDNWETYNVCISKTAMYSSDPDIILDTEYTETIDVSAGETLYVWLASESAD